MHILAVDPGTRTSGWVLYDALPSGARMPGRVLRASKATGNDATIDLIRELRPDRVVCERVSAGRFSGADYLQTSEVVGAVRQECRREGIPCTLLYRRDVLRAIGVPSGAGADSRVRAQMIERHGGDRATACGTKRAPGPLYGVASHAWQALGVAVALVEIVKGEA